MSGRCNQRPINICRRGFAWNSLLKQTALMTPVGEKFSELGSDSSQLGGLAFFYSWSPDRRAVVTCKASHRQPGVAARERGARSLQIGSDCGTKARHLAST